jgi:hypothetical protein
LKRALQRPVETAPYAFRERRNTTGLPPSVRLDIQAASAESK